nr:MAG TPA: hypothetical protein [Bacteriophage sp.]
MIIARVVDFIKSWLYYPEMKRYLREKCNVCYQKSRVKYAWWHCHAGKLKNRR